MDETIRRKGARMAGDLSQQEELFLKCAEKAGLLSKERIFMLRQEKPFYPDSDIGQMAVAKGFLEEAHLTEIRRALMKIAMPGPAQTPPPRTPTPSNPPPSNPPPARPRTMPSRPSPASASARPVRRPQPLQTVSSSPKDKLSDPAIQSLSTLEDYLGFARTKGASDVHLSAGYPPYVRRFGRIQFLDRPPFKLDEILQILKNALTDAQKKTLEEQLNLECAFNIKGQGRYRSTIILHQQGLEGTFHVIASKVPSIDELGVPRAALTLADYRQGMVLITGPSGSGKTSTMAAMVGYVNANRPEHILTLEQPIEYVFEPKAAHVSQREVGKHTRSYARALRAALREDPDVILLGEMRDLETISLAITAAETGHLIFGTLNTTTAARTITRILDSYPPDQQPQIRTMMAESLRGIICQQLPPRQDGQGVALAIEILIVTPGVSSLIREMKIHQVASAIQTGKRMGMVRMDDSLMELYQKGVIDIDEAYRRAEDKRAFAPYLSQ